METIDKIPIKESEYDKSPSQFIPKNDIGENYSEISNLQKPLRSENYISFEDDVFKQFISHKFIPYEEWEDVQNIYARILSKTNDTINCECVIDKENLKLQIRTFPAILFENLISSNVYDLVLITIKTKKGSTRIDVRDGNGIVDKRFFDLNDEWEELRNSGLDKPFHA